MGESGEQPTTTYTDINMVAQIMKDWPAMTKKSANQTIQSIWPGQYIPNKQPPL
jgi:hypothetical protein